MTTDEQQAIVREVLGEGDYELEVLEAHGGTRSAIDTPLWDAVESWVERPTPSAAWRPICVAGFTDSHWFREAFGTVAYGFFPSRAMSARSAARLIHSADERVPVEDLELGVSFLRHAAQRARRLTSEHARRKDPPRRHGARQRRARPRPDVVGVRDPHATTVS